MLLKFSIVVILVALCTAAKKPSFIKRCKSGDVDCIVEVINDIIENHLMEFPKLGLPSYDPWIGGNLTVGGSENSGISVNMHLTDREVRGLSSMKFTRAVGWTKNIRESKIELYGHDNLLNLTGRYSVNGQIASLPILGNGDYEMLLEDVSLQLKIKPDIYLKDGKRHIKIKQIKMQIDPTKFHIELTNLFDGNEELSKALLDGINENWRDAWDELEPTLLPISEEVIKNMLQSIFDLYPYEEFFLSDD